MRNRNLIVILAAVALIAVVFVLALTLRPGPALPDADAPALTVTGEPSTDAPAAYLVVTLDRQTLQPIPLDRTGTVSIPQEGGMLNVVEITPHSIRMLSSTCHNQDCVQQGTVTLDSMDTRVLGNMIICLPHKVSLALYSAEEIAPQNGGAP